MKAASALEISVTCPQQGQLCNMDEDISSIFLECANWRMYDARLTFSCSVFSK